MKKGEPMKRKDADRINENAAVYGAMLKAGFAKKKPKLSEAEFARRYGREAAAQQRRYCNAFALWRTCPRKRCGRARRCLGYVTDCLKRAFRDVHPRLHGQVQRQLMQGVPRNINAAERKARQNLPEDFYAGRTSAPAKAGEGDHP
jgi:hypothetical protein